MALRSGWWCCAHLLCMRGSRAGSTVAVSSHKCPHLTVVTFLSPLCILTLSLCRDKQAFSVWRRLCVDSASLSS